MLRILGLVRHMLMCNQPVATMKKTELGKVKEVGKCSEETCYVLRCILTACTAGSFHSVCSASKSQMKPFLQKYTKAIFSVHSLVPPLTCHWKGSVKRPYKMLGTFLQFLLYQVSLYPSWVQHNKVWLQLVADRCWWIWHYPFIIIFFQLN